MSFSWNPGRCRVVSAEGGRIGGTAGFMKFGFYSYDSGKLLKGFKRCSKIWFVFLESHSGPSREWNAKQGRNLNCQSVLAAQARCSDGPEVGAGREGKSTGLAGGWRLDSLWKANWESVLWLFFLYPIKLYWPFLWLPPLGCDSILFKLLLGCPSHRILITF